MPTPSSEAKLRRRWQPTRRVHSAHLTWASASTLASLNEAYLTTGTSVVADTSGGATGVGGANGGLGSSPSGGNGSYLPPEALSPWSDIITKYLNGTAPSQKRYWRSRNHRHREHRSKGEKGEV